MNQDADASKVKYLDCRGKVIAVADAFAKADGRIAPADLEAIARHYEHACAKHPFFADAFVPSFGDAVLTAQYYAGGLAAWRSCVEAKFKNGSATCNDVLQCEIAEIYDAYCKGEVEHAIEEIFDSIAVLVRMLDVLRGTQKLGRGKAAETVWECWQCDRCGKTQDRGTIRFFDFIGGRNVCESCAECLGIAKKEGAE